MVIDRKGAAEKTLGEKKEIYSLVRGRE